MFKKVKMFLIGRPLRNEELGDEKLNVFWGLPILASDAISSVAYASEEILWVFIAVIGLLAYKFMFLTALSIVLLLLILVFSYRQTIDSYPNGGGSYIVAKDNLGDKPGLVAGASLIIGYILTVSVSTSAGTAAITSAIPAILPFKVEITIALIALMTIGNLRGIKESSRIFGIPTYVFIVSIITMIVTGIVKVYFFDYTPHVLNTIPKAAGDVTLFLLLRAFAAGCAGLTGVEAVSNGIPNFAEPSQKKAKIVLGLIALLVFVIFGGVSFLATLYHAVPNHESTVLSQIAIQVFGNNIMYYVIQISTAIILVMAANTSYSGLPLLLSLVAKDGFAPRQFSIRGERLGYSNGIIMLSIAAGLLVIIYGGDTHSLMPLYAIGVFISFALSQTGMFVKWYKNKENGWRHKAIINGFGALITTITVLIIGYSRAKDGAWIVIVIIPMFVYGMMVTKNHYDDVARQLKLTLDEVIAETEIIEVQKYVIVLVDTLNKSSLKAINYARHIANDKKIVIFHVSIDKAQGKRVQEKWKQCNIHIPIIVRYSPYREVIAPLVKYIESEEHESNPGDIITVVMPQFVVGKWWENIFHNKTADTIKRKLLQDRHIAVVTVPYVLDKYKRANGHYRRDFKANSVVIGK